MNLVSRCFALKSRLFATSTLNSGSFISVVIPHTNRFPLIYSTITYKKKSACIKFVIGDIRIRTATRDKFFEVDCPESLKIELITLPNSRTQMLLRIICINNSAYR